jgi:hypothetical protein
VSLKEWHIRSQAALDTVTNIVFDIAKSLVNGSPEITATTLIDAMPPIFPYIARASLRHISHKPQSEDTKSAMDILERAIKSYFYRWRVSND